jgi:hypothetical protein
MGYISYGQVIDGNDPQVTSVLELADSFGRKVMFGVITDYLPWTRPLLFRQLKT